MPNEIKDMLEPSALEELLQAVKALKRAVAMLKLHEELEELKPQFDIDKALDNLKKRRTDPYLETSMENLERHCTTKVVDDEVHFLLHRATESGEYQRSTDDAEDADEADLHFESDTDTEWMVDVQASEEEQEGRSPHVSCFIPKSAITDIKNFGENTGTWGELSDTHPDQNKGKVCVKPGKYRIHQELRQ